MAADSEDFVIVAFVVLTQYCSVTDRQTNASTVAKMHLTLRAVACKNSTHYYHYRNVPKFSTVILLKTVNNADEYQLSNLANKNFKKDNAMPMSRDQF